MKNKTILVVDDTIANLDILVELLDQYDVIDATNGKDALEIVEDEHIDLILLDIMMPEMDGYEICQRLKSEENTKDIPIIFITAKTDENSIERAYDIGGADYVTKPFQPKELLARVKKELQIQELMNNLKLLASTDPLTKLYNRRYFANVSQHILELSKRQKNNLSIIIIDIDKFKNINDTYGHQAGDSVIVALANKLLHSHRKSDLACRYGGEEFVILLPNTQRNEALQVAEKLRKEIADISVDFQNKQHICFTVSIGVSEVVVANEPNIEKALKRADDALYEAKNSGRNKVCSI
ncbi:diguanylate cyclase [Sulfurimonas sp.]